MKTRRFLLMVGLVLAMALTFSCSSDDDGGGGSSSSVGNDLPSSSSADDNGDGGSVAYEGQTYRTIKIGTQTWMAENLNYAVEGSKCYGNDPDNCIKYGRLYDWSTAMGLASSCNSSSCSSQIQFIHKGICPDGWHIPSQAEWDVLRDYVGDYNKLRAKNGWDDNGGTDDYGFSALPGGYGFSNGSFGFVGDLSFWWSATEYNASYAHPRGIHYNYSVLNFSDKSFLKSIRCVQD